VRFTGGLRVWDSRSVPREPDEDLQIAPERNVELKAADSDPQLSLAVCLGLGAADHGELRQTDTYFRARHGGLKLREQHPGRPHLVQFLRTESSVERESQYRLAWVDDGPSTRAALEQALGVVGQVRKMRRLLIWEGVRIHLDQVDGLGRFIELEAVAPPQSDLNDERAKVARLRSALAISDDRLVALGYAELLYGRLHFGGTAWHADVGRNPLWQYLDLETGCHK